MTQSLRALLAHSIDYAGLFPPAQLSLKQTIQNHARYLQSSDAWMLGRLILPAAKLADSEKLGESLFSESARMHISTLVGGGNTAEEFAEKITHDLSLIASFRSRASSFASVELAEVKLPPTISSTELSDQLRRLDDARLQCFVEAPLNQIAIVAGAYAGIQHGVKFRTGGVEASAFPSPSTLASCIAQASGANLPMKFTAGLHHPLRAFQASVQTKMFGFINVLFASLLARFGRVDTPQLAAVLECEDANSVEVSDVGIRLGEFFLSTEQIASQRPFVTSFGSCSFDEPRDDLKSLGWM